MDEELNEIPEIEVEAPTFEVEVDEEGESIALSENYGEVESTAVYLDPVTGEQLDPNNLGPFEKIKFIANQLGQTLDEPEKNCKLCHGRGYTSIDVKTQLPSACSCIYKTYRKSNPNWQEGVRPQANRSAKRAHQKRISKFVSKMMPEYEKREKIKENSKAGLGKNTPGYVAKEYREAYNEANGISNVTIDLDDVVEGEVVNELPLIDTAEGVIGTED